METMVASGPAICVKDLNPLLICVLCGGYYIDATTIIECLHSFCRSCIVKYLESCRYCPICEVQVHKTKPLANIRQDKTLQDIVYKLVPGLFAREMRSRREFYRDRPHYIKPMDSESIGEVSEGTALAPPGESLAVALEYQPAKGSIIDKGEVRYFRCPAAVSLYHLAKLVRAKHELSEEGHRIELAHEGRVLHQQLTLTQVACISHCNNATLELTCRILDNTPKRQKLNHEVEEWDVRVKGSKQKKLEESSVVETSVNEGREVQLQISESGVMSVSEIQDEAVVKMVEERPDTAEKVEKQSSKPRKQKQYKTMRHSPKTWHPVITREKLRPTLMKTEESGKPAKFFKARNTLRLPANKDSDGILRIDPKTLRPMEKSPQRPSDKSPQPSNLLTNPFIPNSNHFLFSDPLLLPPTPEKVNGVNFSPNLSNLYEKMNPLIRAARLSPFSTYPGYHTAGFHASLPPSISMLLNPQNHFRSHASSCDSSRNLELKQPRLGPQLGVAGAAPSGEQKKTKNTCAVVMQDKASIAKGAVRSNESLSCESNRLGASGSVCQQQSTSSCSQGEAAHTSPNTQPSRQTSPNTQPSRQTSPNTHPGTHSSPNTQPSTQTSHNIHPSTHNSSNTHPSTHNSLNTQPRTHTSSNTHPSTQTSPNTQPCTQTSHNTQPSTHNSPNTQPSAHTSFKTHPIKDDLSSTKQIKDTSNIQLSKNTSNTQSTIDTSSNTQICKGTSLGENTFSNTPPKDTSTSIQP